MVWGPDVYNEYLAKRIALQISVDMEIQANKDGHLLNEEAQI